MPFDFAASYEALNPDDQDYRFYAGVAQEVGALRVLDLGCGTGVLARMLTALGCVVTGVDPDQSMLEVARSKDPAGEVTWVHGFSDQAVSDSADLAVMSGHVAQVFVTDAAWDAALADLQRALVPGGTLAFESRNPEAEAWRHWTKEETLRTIETPGGSVEFWHETVAVDLPRVSYDTFAREITTGTETRTREVLAFRTVGQIVASLERAGFTHIEAYGNWDRSPVDEASPELIVIARSPTG